VLLDGDSSAAAIQYCVYIPYIRLQLSTSQCSVAMLLTSLVPVCVFHIAAQNLFSAAGKVAMLHSGSNAAHHLASLSLLFASPVRFATSDALATAVQGTAGWCAGENICTQAGRKYAEKMAQDLQGHQKHPPLNVDISNDGPAVMTLSVVNTDAFKLVM